MISMARSFGAPETVPAGKGGGEGVERVGSRPAGSPVTVETRCCTWENRSTSMNRLDLDRPGAADPPESFRARSTSIRCSARSFASATEFIGEAVVLRGGGPARARARDGHRCYGSVPRPGGASPGSTRRLPGRRPRPGTGRGRGSGHGGRHRGGMGSPSNGRSIRRETTIWRQSPASTWPRAAPTAASNRSRSIEDTPGGILSRGYRSGGTGAPSLPGDGRRASIALNRSIAPAYTAAGSVSSRATGLRPVRTSPPRGR